MSAATGKLRYCVLCLLAAVPVPGVAQESPSEPDIETITRRLVDWKKSFTNLRLVCEIRNPGQWLKRKPELANAANLDGYYRRYEWIYTDQGRVRLERHDFEGGTLVTRWVDGNDGQIGFHSEFDRDSSIPKQLDIKPLNPSRFSRVERMAPVSLLYIMHDEWIGDVFRRSHPKVVRYESKNGARCAVIRRADDAMSTLWLDLDHDCLPVCEEFDQGQGLFGDSIREFRKLNNDRWFPVRGTRLLAADDTPYEWVVPQVEVNLALPPNRFACPQPGPDTRIFDFIGKRASTPKAGPTQETGRSPAVDQPLKRVTAEIPTTPWRVLAWSGAIVLVLGLCWRFFRRTH